MNIRGVATKFWLGGRIQVIQNHLPPNSDFSWDFAHFISEIPENPNFSVNIQKIFLKNRDFWGDIPPEFWTGGTCPPIPPVATPMMNIVPVGAGCVLVHYVLNRWWFTGVTWRSNITIR